MSERPDDNPHFRTVSSYVEAADLLAFDPVQPSDDLGHPLQSLSIHVRDHKTRELAIIERTLEAHHGAFVFSQSLRGTEEARRLTIDTAYGAEPKETHISGREGRLYELGSEPPVDDIDGRSPAVVVWHDQGRFYLLASDRLTALDLVRIAGSVYA